MEEDDEDVVVTQLGVGGLRMCYMYMDDILFL
jgi:hypothetical protein